MRGTWSGAELEGFDPPLADHLALDVERPADGRAGIGKAFRDFFLISTHHAHVEVAALELARETFVSA